MKTPSRNLPALRNPVAPVPNMKGGPKTGLWDFIVEMISAPPEKERGEE